MTSTFTAHMTGWIIGTTAATGKLQQFVLNDDRSMASTFATDVTGWIICTTTGKRWCYEQGNSNHTCKQVDFHGISPHFGVHRCLFRWEKPKPITLREADASHQLCVRKSAIRADTVYRCFYSLKFFNIILVR
jgi:hypothetical protein